MVPIARHAPVWADAQMARLAPELTVNQISKIARGYTWEIDEPAADDPAPDDDGCDEPVEPETVEPETAGVDDRAWYGWGDDGRFRLHLEVGADTGSVISIALDECHDRLFHDRNDTASVSTVDAVVEMAERSIHAIPGESRRNRARVNVFIDAENGTFSDNRGRPMPTGPAQRITCDALLSRIDVVDGIPVSVGRSQHIVPERTRRIVEHRDGGCRVPGCGSERVVEVHHIVHWSQGGPTDTANLICLCPKHHRLHHQGKLGIAGDADRPPGTAGAVDFHDRRGRPIRPSGASPNQPTGPPPAFDGTWHHPANERIDHRYLHFHEPA